VKDAVVDAVDELYLGNCDAEAAADNLVGLAQGSSLGASCRLRCVCQEWCGPYWRGLAPTDQQEASTGFCGSLLPSGCEFVCQCQCQYPGGSVTLVVQGSWARWRTL